MNITASLQISRLSDNTIRISIVDANYCSGVEAILTPEQFAYAVTGLSIKEVNVNVIGAEHFGKRKIREFRVARCPFTDVKSDDSEALEEWLRVNCQEPGWILDTCLGSKGSVNRDFAMKELILSYNVYRFEEAKLEDANNE